MTATCNFAPSDPLSKWGKKQGRNLCRSKVSHTFSTQQHLIITRRYCHPSTLVIGRLFYHILQSIKRWSHFFAFVITRFSLQLANSARPSSSSQIAKMPMELVINLSKLVRLGLQARSGIPCTLKCPLDPILELSARPFKKLPTP